MTNSRNNIFSDRRKSRDRRTQNLPIPAGLDRRRGSRRCRQFTAQPWWLRTNYAAELVSESTVIESGLIKKLEKELELQKELDKDKQSPPGSKR